MRKPGRSHGAFGCARSEPPWRGCRTHRILRVRVLTSRSNDVLLSYLLTLANIRAIVPCEIEAHRQLSRIQSLHLHFRPSCFQSFANSFSARSFSFQSNSFFFFCFRTLLQSFKKREIPHLCFLALTHSFSLFRKVMIRHHQSFQSFAHSLQKTGGRGYTFCIFPDPSRFGYNLPPWPGCRPVSPVALSGSRNIRLLSTSTRSSDEICPAV
jgi:hypothetical protein